MSVLVQGFVPFDIPTRGERAAFDGRRAVLARGAFEDSLYRANAGIGLLLDHDERKRLHGPPVRGGFAVYEASHGLVFSALVSDPAAMALLRTHRHRLRGVSPTYRATAVDYAGSLAIIRSARLIELSVMTREAAFPHTTVSLTW